jgi:hypothetical protein
VESSDATGEPYLVENLGAGEARVENRRQREGDTNGVVVISEARRRGSLGDWVIWPELQLTRAPFE